MLCPGRQIAMAVDMGSSLCAWAQWSLQSHLYENAIFLAERVLAESSSEASKLLLATCYFQSGAPNRAEMVLLGCKAPQNRYLLALCAMRLGKLNDAQEALLGTSSHEMDEKANIPNGAAGLYLMGMICLKSQQRDRAIKFFSRCLAINPFLWSAYEALCQLGAPLPEPTHPPDAIPMPPPAANFPPPLPTLGANSGTDAMPAGGHYVPASATATPCASPLGTTPVRPPLLFTPNDIPSNPHGMTNVPPSSAAFESVRLCLLASACSHDPLTRSVPPVSRRQGSGHSLSTPSLQTPQVQATL